MGIYQTCYDLLNTYVFGNTVVQGSHADLVCVFLSTIACIAVIAVPFVVVWRAITFITSRW